MSADVHGLSGLARSIGCRDDQITKGATTVLARTGLIRDNGTTRHFSTRLRYDWPDLGAD
jgi:hypothetical protein